MGECPLGSLKDGKAAGTRNERVKNVTFEEDIRATDGDRPAPNGSPGDKASGGKVIEKPEKLANSQQGMGDKRNSKRKRGGKGSWKSRQDSSEGKDKKPRVGAEDKQPKKEGIADGDNKSKKKRRRSKSRRMASNPGRANNYLD